MSVLLFPVMLCLQVLIQTLSIQDQQLVEHLIPATVSLCPFFYYVSACQIQHLFQSTVTWKYALGLCHFPVLTIQPFDDICRVKPISA